MIAGLLLLASAASVPASAATTPAQCKKLVTSVMTFKKKVKPKKKKAFIKLICARPGSGTAGATGATGPQGVPGSRGVTGPVGATGAPGSNGGATGATGPRGATGADGLSLIGPTGPRGLPGLDGLLGPTGPRGLPGLDGLLGPTGPTGLTGIQGIPGLSGIAGLITGSSSPTSATGGATSWFAGWNQTSRNVDGDFDPATGRYTVPETGRYLIDLTATGGPLSAVTVALGAAQATSVQVLRNNSPIDSVTAPIMNVNIALLLNLRTLLSDAPVTLSKVYDLNADDVLSFAVNNNTSTPVSYTPSLSITKLP